MPHNFTKYQPIFKTRLLSELGDNLCWNCHYRSHHTSSVSVHYLVKCQMTHWSRRRHWPIAWSTLIEPGMRPPNNPDLNPVNYAVRDALQQMAYQCWRFTTVNQLKKAIVAEWGKVPQRLVDRAIGQFRRGFDASSSSKADTLKIWCKTVKMWFLDNNWDNKRVVFVGNFLKCVVTKVVALIVIFKTLTFHKVI